MTQNAPGDPDVGVSGAGVAGVVIGGRFGQELEAQGAGAATEFRLDGLRALLGSDVIEHIPKTDQTGLMGNPFTLSSHGAARPGRAHVRQVLAEPVAGR